MPPTDEGGILVVYLLMRKHYPSNLWKALGGECDHIQPSNSITGVRIITSNRSICHRGPKENEVIQSAPGGGIAVQTQIDGGLNSSRLENHTIMNIVDSRVSSNSLRPPRQVVIQSIQRHQLHSCGYPVFSLDRMPVDLFLILKRCWCPAAASKKTWMPAKRPI